MMPSPIDIDAFLHSTSVEWKRLEFKPGCNPLAVLHSLCAFPNNFHNLGGGDVISIRARNVAPRRYRNQRIGEDHSYSQVRLPVQSATRIAVTGMDGRQVTEQVTEQVMQIVKALGTHEFRSREFMELLGLKHSPTFLYDYLKPSFNACFVHMTLPDKPRRSKQRYRVTDSGKKMLTQQEDNDDHNGKM